MKEDDRTFIRVEDLKIKCVTVVLLQSNGIWAVCLFDKQTDKNEYLDFNNFVAAMTYADTWIRQKRLNRKVN